MQNYCFFKTQLCIIELINSMNMAMWTEATGINYVIVL